MSYSFDILTSRIGNLSLYNKFYHIYFTCYLLILPAPYAYAHDTVSMHALGLRFIDVRVLVHARHLAFTIPLVGCRGKVEKVLQIFLKSIKFYNNLKFQLQEREGTQTQIFSLRLGSLRGGRKLVLFSVDRVNIKFF